MHPGKNPILAGAVLILVGIVLFWCSTRRTLSATARGFLEGQGSFAIPTGLAAIAFGAGKGVRERERDQIRKKRKDAPHREGS